MSAWHGGKGSAPRKVDKKKFDENWDRIFSKKKDDVLDAYNEERLVSKYDKASKIPVDNKEENK
jgi:hypothetical protein